MGRVSVARVVLAASGTVTLQLALAGVPTVAAYRLPLIEEAVLRLGGPQTGLHSVILANLVIGENVIPEFLHQKIAMQDTTASVAPQQKPLANNSASPRFAELLRRYPTIDYLRERAHVRVRTLPSNMAMAAPARRCWHQRIGGARRHRTVGAALA